MIFMKNFQFGLNLIIHIFIFLSFFLIFLFFIRTVRNTVAYKSNNLIPRDNDVQELTIFVGTINKRLLLFFFIIQF